jgi:glycerophosphoryl diester phosphodiesterase
MHPYTFRIDKLPDYAKTYDGLLKIFFDDLEVEGIFTDFTDLTFDYLESSNMNSSNKYKASASLLFFIAGYFLYFFFFN